MSQLPSLRTNQTIVQLQLHRDHPQATNIIITSKNQSQLRNIQLTLDRSSVCLMFLAIIQVVLAMKNVPVLHQNCTVRNIASVLTIAQTDFQAVIALDHVETPFASVTPLYVNVTLIYVRNVPAALVEILET